MAHGHPRAVGDGHAVPSVAQARRRFAVGLVLHGEELRRDARHDLDVQAALVELGQDLDQVCGGGGALDEDRAAVPLAGLEVAHHVRTTGRLEMRRDAERLAVRNVDRRPSHVEGHDGHVRAHRRGQHDGHLVVFPRVQVDDVAFREKLGDICLEDAEVGARVFGRLWAGVASDPEHLAHLQLGVLRELAEQAHGSVLEI